MADMTAKAASAELRSVAALMRQKLGTSETAVAFCGTGIGLILHDYGHHGVLELLRTLLSEFEKNKPEVTRGE